MSISHVYRSYEVIYRTPFETEVPALGLTLPTEAAAHKAIDAALEDWVAGYDRTVDTAD